jgi:SNF2 family DNA or RNA helicase
MMQIIALLSALYAKSGTPLDRAALRARHRIPSSYPFPSLIFCPKSLIDTWVIEFKRWSYFQVDVVSSSGNNANTINKLKQGLFLFILSASFLFITVVCLL